MNAYTYDEVFQNLHSNVAYTLLSLVAIMLYLGISLNINLMIFNLIPLPPLDGSRMVFTLIEWIFRKPVPRKIEAIIHTVGMVLLFGCAICADVFQFLS